MSMCKNIIAVSAVCIVLITAVGFGLKNESGIAGVSAEPAGRIREMLCEKTGNTIPTGSKSQKKCTILYASDGETALGGSNEDSTNPFPIVWFQPAKDGKYGGMYFGFQDFSPKAVDWHSREGGINEKGLFYDFASTEEVQVPRDPNKPDCWLLMNKVMEECSTVDEAIKLFSEYNFREVWKGHLLIGDRFGNSAIIEPLAFIRKSQKYQIATNFLQSGADSETSTDERYMLASKLFEQSDEISIDLFRRILSDTHLEEYGGSMCTTLYSYICNLKNGDVYIYNFHDYNTVVKLNIHEELKKGEHAYLISTLFPYETYSQQGYKATRATFMLLEKAMQSGVTGEDGAVAFYRALKSMDDKPVKYNLGEIHLTAAGHALIQYNMIDRAIELFTFMVEEFQQSASAYSTLADAYVKAGNTELAKEKYRKSLELNPDDENAKKMLQQL